MDESSQAVKEMERCSEKWGSHLKDLAGYPKRVIALLMENQNLINEQIKDDYWRAKSLEIVRNMYDPRHFLGFDLVNVQPMLGPCGLVTYGIKSNIPLLKWYYVTEDIIAKTRSIKTCWSPPSSMDLRGDYLYIEDLYCNIANEINREILSDLRNNCGTVMTKSYGEPWLDEILGVFLIKSFFYPDWIVTSTDGVTALTKDFDFSYEITKPRHSLSVRRAGVLRHKKLTLKVYEDPLFPKDNILMGRKGDTYDAQYMYCPYVPLTLTAPFLDPETFTFSHRRIMTRYGKKLAQGGAKHYVRIILKGMEDKPTTDQ